MNNFLPGHQRKTSITLQIFLYHIMSVYCRSRNAFGDKFRRQELFYRENGSNFDNYL